MKTLIAVSVLLWGATLQGQSVADKVTSAEKIYVAPLKYYTYYGLKLTGSPGTKPYSYTGEFNVGDVVSVTDPNYSYEIIGEVSPDQLKAINDHILAQLQEKWGDKVQPWPEDMVNKMGNFNEKDIDCNVYITVKRAAWLEPLRVAMDLSGDPATMKGGTENIIMVLYEKEKAGKKGKKVARVMSSPFGELQVAVADAGNYGEAGAEFSSKANDQLQGVIDSMLENLYSQ